MYDVLSFQNQQATPIKQAVGAGRFIVRISWYYDVQYKNVEKFIIYRTIGQKTKGGASVTGRTILWKSFSPKQSIYTGTAPNVQVITPVNDQDLYNSNPPPTQQSTKGVDYYMVEDDDIFLINQTPHGELHYQIIVEYEDGTTSRMSPYLTVH
jgi:hypothetical protein